MRKFLLIIALMVCATGVAQQFKRVYFFDNFTDALVLYKTGQKYTLKMNYDANNQVMLYMQGDVMMELTNPYQVDTIYIAERKMVYRESRFCEVVHVNNNKEVLIGWQIKQTYGGRTGAFGLPTQAQVIKLRAVDLIGPEHGHNMNAGMEVSQYDARSADLEVWKQKNNNTYFINIGDRIYGLRTLKDVYKTFPEHKDKIKAYVKENKLDMMHTNRALKLMDYLLNNL